MRGMHRKKIIRRFTRTNMSSIPQASGFNARFLTNKIKKLMDNFFFQIFKAYQSRVLTKNIIAENFNAVLLIIMHPEKNKVCMKIACIKLYSCYSCCCLLTFYLQNRNSKAVDMILSYIIAVNYTF